MLELYKRNINCIIVPLGEEELVKKTPGCQPHTTHESVDPIDQRSFSEVSALSSLCCVGREKVSHIGTKKPHSFSTMFGKLHLNTQTVKLNTDINELFWGEVNESLLDHSA